MEAFLKELERFFGPLAEGYEILITAISLPLDLISLLPVIIGSAVSIVLFVMIVKFILGR